MANKLWTPFGNSDKLLVSSTGKILVCETCPCDEAVPLEAPRCPPDYSIPDLVMEVVKVDGDVDCLVGTHVLDFYDIGSDPPFPGPRYGWFKKTHPELPTLNTCTFAATDPDETECIIWHIWCDRSFINAYKMQIARFVYTNQPMGLGVFVNTAITIGADKDGQLSGCGSPIVTPVQGSSPFYAEWLNLPACYVPNISNGDKYNGCSDPVTAPGNPCGHVDVIVTEP